MRPPQFVVLAAGIGGRLGRSIPKPLTRLATGRSIAQQQLDNIRGRFGADARVLIVVGFKMGLVIEAVPDVTFAYNEHYHRTNTSKSLLKALRLSADGGVVWLNGDVVFDPAVLDVMAPHIEADESFVCVNTAVVGEEEIKYTVDGDGYVRELSKTVAGGLGEAVGINHVAAADREALAEHLAGCADTDYFERAMETAIAAGRLRFRPLDISRFYAVEVDFPADLDRANSRIGTVPQR